MPAYNTDQQQSEFWKLKIDKETDEPHFVRVEKKNDAWVETDVYNAMKGQLIDVTLKTYTWEGKQKQSMVLTLIHETGVKMIVTASFSNMTRALLNSLAGCDSIGVLDMQAAKWGKKGADKKYPTVFVQNNGQKTSWKYPMEKIPAVESIKNKKGEVVSVDDSDANEFFKLVIQNEIIPKLHSPQEVKTEMHSQNGATSKTHTTEKVADNLPDDLDQLPF